MGALLMGRAANAGQRASAGQKTSPSSRFRRTWRIACRTRFRPLTTVRQAQTRQFQFKKKIFKKKPKFGRMATEILLNSSRRSRTSEYEPVGQGELDS